MLNLLHVLVLYSVCVNRSVCLSSPQSWSYVGGKPGDLDKVWQKSFCCSSAHQLLNSYKIQVYKNTLNKEMHHQSLKKEELSYCIVHNFAKCSLFAEGKKQHE